jgi:hypothetical protein
MEELADDLTARGETWKRCMDADMVDRIMSGFAELGATEAAIWLRDAAGDHLVPVFNNTPTLESLVGVYRQPLDRGIISMVLAIQSAVIERDVYKNPQHDSTVDRQLGQVTVHMMAVPLYFAGDSRGVISAVRLRSAGTDEDSDPPPFEETHLESLKKSARELGQSLDRSLTELSTEWPGS